MLAESGIVQVEEQVLQTFYQQAGPLKLMAIVDDTHRMLTQVPPPPPICHSVSGMYKKFMWKRPVSTGRTDPIEFCSMAPACTEMAIWPASEALSPSGGATLLGKGDLAVDADEQHGSGERDCA